MTELLKTPGPSCIHGPASYLTTLPTDFSYAPDFLTRAAEATDFIERLKLISTMSLAGHHIQPTLMSLRALLNPIIGETIQAYLVDGT